MRLLGWLWRHRPTSKIAVALFILSLMIVTYFVMAYGMYLIVGIPFVFALLYMFSPKAAKG